MKCQDSRKTCSIYIHTSCIIEKKKNNFAKKSKSFKYSFVFVFFLLFQPNHFEWFDLKLFPRLFHFRLHIVPSRSKRFCFSDNPTRFFIFFYFCMLSRISTVQVCIWHFNRTLYVKLIFFIVLWLWIITVSTTLKYIHFGTSLLTFFVTHIQVYNIQWTSLFYYY